MAQYLLFNKCMNRGLIFVYPHTPTVIKQILNNCIVIDLLRGWFHILHIKSAITIYISKIKIKDDNTKLCVCLGWESINSVTMCEHSIEFVSNINTEGCCIPASAHPAEEWRQYPCLSDGQPGWTTKWKQMVMICINKYQILNSQLNNRLF